MEFGFKNIEQMNFYVEIFYENKDFFIYSFFLLCHRIFMRQFNEKIEKTVFYSEVISQ
jgi:hypothetical protein